MIHTCVRGEDLAVIEALPSGDPRRRDAEACARCRARLMAFASFVAALDVPAEAGLEEADARLAAILEARTGGRVKGDHDWRDGTPVDDGDKAAAAEGRRWLDRLLVVFGRPALRPAWAAVVVLLAVWGVRESGLIQRPGDRSIELRGESGRSPGGIETLDAVMAADGSMVVAWKAVPGADRYAIVVCDASLRETSRVEAGPELSGRLDSDLSGRASGSDPLFWGVVAYRGGDEIARSEIRSVPPANGR